MTRIILIMIIERKEAETIRSLRPWTLVYGRRKTGKTFLVKNFVKWDEYFFVKRDRTILAQEEETINYDAFIALVSRGIKDGKTIVIDEFHRLPEEFFDFLHNAEKKGRVILVSSTLALSQKFFLAHSPLLGLFAEMHVPIIDLKDTLKAVKSIAPKKERLELAMVLREPLAVPFLSNEKARVILNKVILFSQRSIPALIGEIFSEEGRTLSAIYEGILRAVADGRVISSEIASYLFSRKLIEKDDPSIIQQHLITLVKLGILAKIEVVNRKRFIYKHRSPLVRLFYLADEKYNITERELTEQELQEIVNLTFPKLIEDTIREHFAAALGLREAVAEAKDFEVDACLLRFKKINTVIEVKWKNILKNEEVAKVERNLARFPGARKILFVPDKKGIAIKGIEVRDVEDLIL